MAGHPSIAVRCSAWRVRAALLLVRAAVLVRRRPAHFGVEMVEGRSRRPSEIRIRLVPRIRWSPRP